MNLKEEKFIKRWSKTRKIGKIKYQLIFGGTWGLFTSVFIQLLKLENRGLTELYFSRDFLIQLGLFLILGIFGFGLTLWKVNEKKLEKYQTKTKDH